MPSQAKYLTGGVVRDLLRGRQGDGVVLEVMRHAAIVAHASDPSHTEYHSVPSILSSRAYENKYRPMPPAGAKIEPSLTVTGELKAKHDCLVLPVIHGPTEFSFEIRLSSIANKIKQVRWLRLSRKIVRSLVWRAPCLLW